MAKTTHIAIVSSPGFGHIVPIIEFSKRLVKLHPNFQVTCIIPSLESSTESCKAYLKTLPSFIDFIFLPPVSIEQLSQGGYIGQLIQLTISHLFSFIILFSFILFLYSLSNKTLVKIQT